MEKYQVFISSTSQQLVEVRSNLIIRLLRKNTYFPIAMENFTAHSDTINMLYTYLTQTDIYVLILKDSDGSSIGPNGAESVLTLTEEHREIMNQVDILKESTGKSLEELTFTQIEYAFAKALKLPIFAFVYHETKEESLSERISKFVGCNFSHAASGWTSDSELLDVVISSLDLFIKDEVNPLSGWIRKMDSPLFQKTRKAGIQEISLDGGGFPEILKDILPDCKELHMFFTTGRGFIVNHQSLMAQFLANGGCIKLLCGMPGSVFLTDIARVEESRWGKRDDIHKEFREVIQTWGHIYASAKKIHEEKQLTKPIGTVEIGGSKTLFRSTILVCEKEDGSSAGWLTVTLPPEKSRDSISLKLEYKPGVSDPKDNIMIYVRDHFRCCWDQADCDKLTTKITDQSDLQAIEKKFTIRENSLVGESYWEAKRRNAIVNQRKLCRRKKILIEVAAQHPLLDGREPDTEFAARLDGAIDIYHKKIEEGYTVEFYLPGSVHLDRDQIPDEVSLSEAAICYLVEHGVPKNILHGQDLVDRYQEQRVWPGVYNTGDECDIASRYFKEPEMGFGSLICVCSPNQVMRVTLFYLENEILPMIVSIPTEKMSHNFVYEIYNSVPNILMNDHSYQEQDSQEALRTRRERMLGFSELKGIVK